MTKHINYQIKRSENIRRKQEESQSATIYIIKQYGPTFYLLQDDTEQKFKVHLGDIHTCSCDNYVKTQELCIHICWLLIKRLKVDPNNPISWQLGLVEREISALLHGQYTIRNKHSEGIMNISLNNEENNIEKVSDNNQRRIEEDDVCPICQEYLLSSKRFPVTFCRKSCGNNVHIKCMKVWTDYQRKQNSLGITDDVICPVCRQAFASFSILIHEFTENLHTPVKIANQLSSTTDLIVSSQVMNRLNFEKNPVKHLNTRCLSCLHDNLNPFLCGGCFRLDKHAEHDQYTYKELPNSKWLDVPLNRGAIKNLTIELINKTDEAAENRNLNSIEESNEREPLEPLQLNELANIHQWIIHTPRNRSNITQLRKSPRGKLSINSMYSKGLLSPGRQCLICLMSFKVNDQVRRLSSGCQHIFHSACIDPWLLHRSPTCPIDHVIVQPRKLLPDQSLTIRNDISSLEMDKVLSNHHKELKICAKQIETKPKMKTTKSLKNVIPPKIDSLQQGISISSQSYSSDSLNVIGQHMLTEYTRKL
ncbi:unnamed protein product [Heterobilharzia americana]|nr:unnamed protein product [Heterobilharzia americana]